MVMRFRYRRDIKRHRGGVGILFHPVLLVRYLRLTIFAMILENLRIDFKMDNCSLCVEVRYRPRKQNIRTTIIPFPPPVSITVMF